MGKKTIEKGKSISTEKMIRKEWIYPSLIALLGFCYYMTYINYGIRVSDEGFLVDGAERVLRGQLPMSDFMSYPPGSYFLLALLFKLFGVNLLISRFMEMGFLLINGLMMFYIGKRLMPSRWALIPSFILILFPGPWYKVFFTFGLLLPLITLIRFLEKRTAQRILIVGWAVGLALVFKIESGLYSLLTIGILLFLQSFWEEGKFVLNKKTILIFFKVSLLCFSALLSIIMPLMIFYHYKSVLTKLVFSLQEAYGAADIEAVSEFFGKPSLLKAVTKFHIGNLEHLFFYLILLVYLYFFGKVLFHLFVHKRKDFPPFLPVLIMGVLSLSYAYVAFGKSHLLQSAAVAYLLFGLALYLSVQRKERISKVLVFMMVVLFGLFFVDNFKMKSHFSSGSISRLYAIKKEGARLISSSKGNVYEETRQCEAINGLLRFFEGKEGYLMSLYYDPMINFLTGLENPTKFTILAPVLIKKPLRQKQVIDEVERYKIKYLLIRQPIWVSQDSLGFNQYAPILYEFVSTHYKLEKDVGGYLIFCRVASNDEN